MKKKNCPGKVALALTLAALMSGSALLAGCGTQPQSGNLMEKITAQPLSAQPLAEEIEGKFANATTEFSLELFRRTWQEQRNSLISPVSSVLALGMLTNGAGGSTQEQLLSSLAGETLTVQQLNQAYQQWAKRLTDIESGIPVDDWPASEQKFELANALWLHNGFTVKEPFLQTNADFFGAGAFTLDFNDPNAALQAMNQWASQQTDGEIQQAVDSLDPNSQMVLMNTALFEMPWVDPVEPHYISQRTFTAADGKQSTVDFMQMQPAYLETSSAQGMRRGYRNQNFCFVALLPKEGKTLADVVQNMTAEEWLSLVGQSRDDVLLDVHLPKFQYEVSNQLGSALKEMGVRDAFDVGAADFTGITDDPLWVGNVVQKAKIDVNERGTSAAAVTSVLMCGAGAPTEREHKVLSFDHPFLYAIIDEKTGIPLFLGTVADAGQTGLVSEVSASHLAQPQKIDITKCEDYQTVPFRMTDSQGNILQTEIFPGHWGGAIYCTTGPQYAFAKKFEDGGVPDTVGEHTKLVFDFGEYIPAEITVRREIPTHTEYGAEVDTTQAPTAVSYEPAGEAGRYAFEVDFGEQEMLYYIISAEWDGSHTVEYAVAVRKA